MFTSVPASSRRTRGRLIKHAEKKIAYEPCGFLRESGKNSREIIPEKSVAASCTYRYHQRELLRQNSVPSIDRRAIISAPIRGSRPFMQSILEKDYAQFKFQIFTAAPGENDAENRGRTKGLG